MRQFLSESNGWGFILADYYIYNYVQEIEELLIINFLDRAIGM